MFEFREREREREILPAFRTTRSYAGNFELVNAEKYKTSLAKKFPFVSKNESKSAKQNNTKNVLLIRKRVSKKHTVRDDLRFQQRALAGKIYIDLTSKTSLLNRTIIQQHTESRIFF